MSLVRPMVSPLVRPMVTTLTGCRFIPTFNGATQLMTAPRITGIDLDNLDIELEGYFNLTGIGTLWSQSISGTVTNREFQIFTNSTDGITFVLGGASTKIAIGSAVKQDAALWGVRINGTSTTIYKNGTEVGSGTTAIGASREPTASFKVNARGAGSDTTYGFFLGGESRNHKVWTGGSRSTGTLVLNSPFDDGFNRDPVARNAAASIGAEQVLSLSWVEVDISTIVDDTVTILSDAIPTTSGVTANLASGDYLIEFDATVTAGNAIISDQGGTAFTYALISQSQHYQFPVTTTNGIGFRNVGANDNVVLTNVSIKQADGFGRFVNLTSGSWSELCE